MEQFERLQDAGIDMDSLLKRLLGNTALVRIFIQKFIEDTTFSKLNQAMDQGDGKAAEMASHTLKGMCGNLSLTELYGLFTQQVDLLRSGEFAKAAELMGAISQAYNQAITSMGQWLQE